MDSLAFITVKDVFREAKIPAMLYASNLYFRCNSKLFFLNASVDEIFFRFCIGIEIKSFLNRYFVTPCHDDTQLDKALLKANKELASNPQRKEAITHILAKYFIRSFNEEVCPDKYFVVPSHSNNLFYLVWFSSGEWRFKEVDVFDFKFIDIGKDDRDVYMGDLPVYKSEYEDIKECLSFLCGDIRSLTGTAERLARYKSILQVLEGIELQYEENRQRGGRFK